MQMTVKDPNGGSRCRYSVPAPRYAATPMAPVRYQTRYRPGVQVVAPVEASVRRYAAAVSQSDMEGAMVEIAPDQRARWNEWVVSQLGNVYEVRGIAVRAPWLLAGPSDVTTVLDVDRSYPEVYQPT